jgi:hypothetical protein
MPFLGLGFFTASNRRDAALGNSTAFVWWCGGVGHPPAPRLVQRVRTVGDINSVTQLDIKTRAEQDDSRRKEELRG